MELVRVKNNQVFTDSMVIANGTNNQHRSVRLLIEKYEDEFREFGRVSFQMTPLDTNGGVQKIKIYQLSEPQATFLMTLLKNSEKVVRFKVDLTKEFYRMRTALMERQTTEWLQTRQKGKLVRRKETDALAKLKSYAEDQRECKPYKHIYTNYTKLVNNAVGIKTGERNIATFKQLQIVTLLEDMIENTVIEEMDNGVFFKEIYKKCQSKVNTFVSLMYLDTDVKKLNTAV